MADKSVPPDGKFNNSLDFVETMFPYVQRAARELGGIDPIGLMTQWHLESGGGTRISGDYNYFGVKWTRDWPQDKRKLCKTQEYLPNPNQLQYFRTGGRSVIGPVPNKLNTYYVNDWFKSYTNIEEAVQNKIRTLRLPRYQNVRQTKTATEFYRALKASNYATDPNYVAALTNRQRTVEELLRRLNLTGSAGTTTPTPPTAEPAAPAVPPTPPVAPNTGAPQTDRESISPHLGTYESFHPRIQYELTRRKFATETVDTYMPFVKLTSFTYVKGEDVASRQPIGIVGWCPSIGIHGRKAVSADDIYNSFGDISRTEFGTEARTNLIRNSSVVGEITVATKNAQQQRVLSRELRLLSRLPSDITLSDPANIPLPGITNLSIDLSTAGPMGVRGGLFRTDIKMVAYSKNQVDTLLRYFLRPGTRVVLEYGKMSNTKNDFETFDWAREPRVLAAELYNTREYTVGNNQKVEHTFPAHDRLRKKYMYPSDGNYDILIGYVVKFNMKVNKNNIYEITLTMHSLNQSEIPNANSTVKSLCSNALDDKCQAIDIREYFNPSVSWKAKTFAKLLANFTTNQRLQTSYKNEIVKIKNANNQSTGENGFYVSWRFFVQVILNDPEFGILSIFPVKSIPLVMNSLISPLGTSAVDSDKPVKIVHDNDTLIANEVGWHPALLSIDPNTMVIYNPRRIPVGAAASDEEYRLFESIYKQENKTTAVEVSDAERIIRSGPGFLPDTSAYGGQGVSSLLEGVWINTMAIEKAFAENDTITKSLEALLVKMNNATGGYWNLQLLSIDGTTESNTPSNGLHVVDMGLSKRVSQPRSNPRERADLLTSVTQPINNKEQILNLQFAKGADAENKDRPKYIYVFNERNRVFTNVATERLSKTTEVDKPILEGVGSELIDLNVDFGLPIAIASQVIAGVGGSSQKGTLEAIDVNELNDISIFPRTLVAFCDTPVRTDPCFGDPNRQIEIRLSVLNNEKQREIADLGPRPDPNRERSFLQALNEGTSKFFFGGITTATEWDAAKARIEARYQRLTDSLVQGISASGGDSSEVISRIRAIINDYGYAGTVLQLIELNPAEMATKLNLDSRDDIIDEETGERVPKVHAFNSSNLTKVLVDLTLPGISGIHLFQTFLVDRIPSVLQYGYYMVTKVTHELSPSTGWITKVQGRFRYDPLTKGTITPRLANGLEAPRRESTTDTPAPGSPVPSATPSSAPFVLVPFANSNNQQISVAEIPTSGVTVPVSLNVTLTQNNVPVDDIQLAAIRVSDINGTPLTTGIGNSSITPFGENNPQFRTKNGQLQQSIQWRIKTAGDHYVKIYVQQDPTVFVVFKATVTSTVAQVSAGGPESVSYVGKDGKNYTVPIVYDQQGRNSNERALYAAGYRNGRIPSEYLKQIGNGFGLYRDAADAFIQMNEAFKRAYPGQELDLNAAYRTLDRQITLIPEKGLFNSQAPETAPAGQTKGLADVPGKSPHGWALSVDIKSVNANNNRKFNWLKTNAERFGFTNLRGEDWHWNYTKPLITPIPRIL
jgi:hypothetical protein